MTSRAAAEWSNGTYDRQAGQPLNTTYKPNRSLLHCPCLPGNEMRPYTIIGFTTLAYSQSVIFGSSV